MVQQAIFNTFISLIKMLLNLHPNYYVLQKNLPNFELFLKNDRRKPFDGSMSLQHALNLSVVWSPAEVRNASLCVAVQRL